MELERDFIERRDFATVRRGYEPVEVQEHLRSVADRVEELRRELREQGTHETTSLSAAAAEQVRVVLDAAEQSAHAIRENAEQEAQRATEEAARRAEERQAQADAEARAQLDSVQQATQNLHQRAGRLEAELDRLLNRLREAAGEVIQNFRAEGGNLQGELDALRTELDEARSIGTPVGGAVAEPPVGAAPGPFPPTEPVVAEEEHELVDEGPGLVEEEPELVEQEPELVEEEPEVVGEPELVEEEPDRAAGPAPPLPGGFTMESEPGSPVQPPTVNEPLQPAAPAEEPVAEADELAPAAEPLEPEPEPASPSGGSSEGARLIALNMALNGTPREETAEYLRREFNLEDEQMLDDVYARVRST